MKVICPKCEGYGEIPFGHHPETGEPFGMECSMCNGRGMVESDDECHRAVAAEI